MERTDRDTTEPDEVEDQRLDDTATGEENDTEQPDDTEGHAWRR